MRRPQNDAPEHEHPTAVEELVPADGPRSHFTFPFPPSIGALVAIIPIVLRLGLPIDNGTWPPTGILVALQFSWAELHLRDVRRVNEPAVLRIDQVRAAPVFNMARHVLPQNTYVGLAVLSGATVFDADSVDGLDGQCHCI